MTTVAVTGSSGKLGRHVVRDLQDHGYRVVALDRVPDPGSAAAAAVRVDLTDYGQVLEALTGVDDRHDGRRRGGAPRGDPGAGARHQRRHVRQQHHRHLQRVRRGAAGRDPQHRLGVQRDRARAAVRHAAAVHAGRRGVPGAAGEHLLAGQEPRGGDGPAFLPVGAGPEDDRPAVLQRDGPRRLRQVPRRSTPTPRCGGGTCGATSTPATARRRCGWRWSTRPPAWTSSSSPTPTR